MSELYSEADVAAQYAADDEPEADYSEPEPEPYDYGAAEPAPAGELPPELAAMVAQNVQATLAEVLGPLAQQQAEAQQQQALLDWLGDEWDDPDGYAAKIAQYEAAQTADAIVEQRLGPLFEALQTQAAQAEIAAAEASVQHEASQVFAALEPQIGTVDREAVMAEAEEIAGAIFAQLDAQGIPRDAWLRENYGGPEYFGRTILANVAVHQAVASYEPQSEKEAVMRSLGRINATPFTISPYAGPATVRSEKDVARQWNERRNGAGR